MDFFLTSQSYDYNLDGNADRIKTYTYDDLGNQTSISYDKDGDGSAEEITTYTYDNLGNQTSESYDGNGDGNAESITTYTYDNLGNLTKHTREYKYAKKYEGEYEGEEEGEGKNKNVILIETYTYDESGNQTSISYDNDADGNAESITTYTYDESGNQTSISYDQDADGNAESITTYTYDESGNQTSKSSDRDADGNAESITTYTYDESGNQTSKSSDRDADGNAELIRIYTYDKSGNKTSISYDGDADGNADSITTYTYDDSGNQTSYSIDFNGDGNTDSITTYTYDDSGNQTSYSIDFNGDGNTDSIYTYTYDDSGNQTSYSIDFNGDGNADSIYTYTYTKIESDNDGDVASNSLDDKPNGTDEDDSIAAGSGNDTRTEASGNDLEQQVFLPTIRLEAETDYYWKNDAYNVQDIRDASGGNALSLVGGNTNETGIVAYKFTGESGFYNLNLGTFDENDGVAKFAVLVNDEQIGSRAFMGSQLLSRNATVKSAVEKRMLSNYYLETGDIVQVRGFEDGDVEHARLDYLEFEPSRVQTIRMEAETDFYQKSSSYWVQGIKHDIASNNRVLSLQGNGDKQTGYASYQFSGESGYYDLDLGTFDENDGVAGFMVAVNGEQIGETVWSDQEYFSRNPSWKTTVEHRMFSNFYLETGDIVQIQGVEDGGDAARLDYLDFTTVDHFAPDAPVRIEAEDYLAYYDTTSGNQRNANYHSGDDVDIEYGGTGHVITDVKEREWLSFDVENILGTRDVLLRVSSGSRNVFKNIELEVDGKNYVSPNLGYTGGYDRYTDLIVNDVDFNGYGDLQLEFLSYGMKLDYIEIF